MLPMTYPPHIRLQLYFEYEAPPPPLCPTPDPTRIGNMGDINVWKFGKYT